MLDIEASGFGRSSYPIEVGWALPDASAVCMLVRPPSHWTHWDQSAEALHGISRQTLRMHGRSPHHVASTLNHHLQGRTVYCDGWAHDYPWLAALFDEAGVTQGFKLEAVGRLFDDSRLQHLDAARREALQAMGLKRHRASNDARALQRAIGAVAQR